MLRRLKLEEQGLDPDTGKPAASQHGADVAAPELAGDWNVAERQSVGAVSEKLDAAAQAIKAKLGADWQMSVDWKTISTAGLSGKERLMVGKLVVSNFITDWVAKDLGSMEPDVLAALLASNPKKLVTFSVAKSGENFQYMQRALTTSTPTEGIIVRMGSGDLRGLLYTNE